MRIQLGKIVILLAVLLIIGCQKAETPQNPTYQDGGGCGVSNAQGNQGFENCKIIEGIQYCEFKKGV